MVPEELLRDFSLPPLVLGARFRAGSIAAMDLKINSLDPEAIAIRSAHSSAVRHKLFDGDDLWLSITPGA